MLDTILKIIKENNKKKLDEICLKKIKRFEHLWDMDGYIWYCGDDIFVSTNHESLYIMSIKEVEEYIKELNDNVSNIKECLIKKN